MKSLYEILIPVVANDGQTFCAEHNECWRKMVRGLCNGLTVFQQVSGEWVSPNGQLFAEQMVPVRVLATANDIKRISDYSAKHYQQEAIMFHKVTDHVSIVDYTQTVKNELIGDNAKTLLEAEPADRKAFIAWTKDAIAYLEPLAYTFDDPELLEFVATVVRHAKHHAYSLKLYTIADKLPERQGKTTLDGLLRLRECLPKRKPRTDKLTPPQVARVLGVSPETVRGWIRSGELKAVNLADPQSPRPRYRIERDALTSFATGRETIAPTPNPQRQQSRKPRYCRY